MSQDPIDDLFDANRDAIDELVREPIQDPLIPIIEDPLYCKAKMLQSHTQPPQKHLEVHVVLKDNTTQILTFKENDIILTESRYKIIRCENGTLGLLRQ